MGKEEKLAILKSCVGILSFLEQEMRQTFEYAKEGIEENNINLVIGGLCGLEQINQRIKSIYDMMVFVQRL
ncbi:hypothetical protein [Candidatus Avelusimicrobium fimicolum]|uniref:hypothetical protein n=1 Tax=Candidatus Avelusimicrobium fimicolum TaxID=3416216 RepID=UPI003D095B1F